jgi:hypothetical protein
VLAAACSSPGGADTDAGAGTVSTDATTVWGVTIRLSDDAPVPPGPLTGLHVHVTDYQIPPSNVALNVDLAWPSMVGSEIGNVGHLDVTYGNGCDGPEGICGVDLMSTSDCDGASYAGGCLALTMQKLLGIGGTFVHPTGVRCRPSGGNLDMTLRAITGHWMDQTFFLADDSAGTFSIPCWDAAGAPRFLLEGTFQLGVWRLLLPP